jgi:hypothetical protein
MADALARMCEANSEQRIDHVLLEWWLALVLANAEGTTLRYICPSSVARWVGKGGAAQGAHRVHHYGRCSKFSSMVFVLAFRPQITVSPAAIS